MTHYKIIDKPAFDVIGRKTWIAGQDNNLFGQFWDLCQKEGLEIYRVPASQWAVFECIGKVPEAIVKSEIYAFMEWLPTSEYEHAKAPEMEVYFPGNDGKNENSY